MTNPGQIVAIETIMQALLTLLLPLKDPTSPKYGGFKTVTRSFKTPDQVGDVQQPALMILQGPINSVRVGGVPAKQTISAWLFIYTTPTNVDALPSTVLNNCLTAVNSILVEPTFPLLEQTLNGLVSNCWVEGDTIYDDGSIAAPGLAVVPIKILVPAIAI
jgi:hypothetical protein